MCMCDRDDNYLCFYCEEFLVGAVKDLIHAHKNDILDSCDWWWAVETANDKYDVNVFCYEDDTDSPDAVFSVNLYRLNETPTSSYDLSVQWDLPCMTRKDIRLI